MKKWAILLIVLGGGLAAYGISDLAKGFSPAYESVRGEAASPEQMSVWYGWPRNSQIEIVIGVVALLYGAILRKDSK
jgi:hypothetical protein